MPGVETQKRKVGVMSLGCPKNLTDSEVMMGYLKQAGYEVTEKVEEADAVVVNTCSFLQASVNESLQTIREMAQLKSRGTCQKLIVAGCLVERYKEKLLEELPEVDGFIGSGELASVVRLLRESRETPVMWVGKGASLYSHEAPRVRATQPWTAYVKIAEGCDHACAFCTIPQIRGALRSRSIESLVAEVEGLVARGFKEAVLVAQDSTMYGLDRYGRLALAELVKALGQVEGLSWIRVLYGYPSQLTEEMIAALRENPKAIPYFDMPIQHAATHVLRAMKRGYGKETIRKIIQAFRKDLPEFTLRTTVIVGFPGETEDQVKELVDFLVEVQFDHVGAFVYSNEPGTVAACLEEQIPEAVKEERYHLVMHAQQAISRHRNKLFLGKTLPVLVESCISESPRVYVGRSFRDAPEIDGSIIFQSTHEMHLGTFTPVRITDVQDYDLVGVSSP